MAELNSQISLLLYNLFIIAFLFSLKKIYYYSRSIFNDNKDDSIENVITSNDMELDIRSVFDVINRSRMLIDNSIQTNMDEQYEYEKQGIISDETLTKYQQSRALELLAERYNFYKVVYHQGTKRICENCHNECFARMYCEHCIRNCLKAKFSDWTSRNDDIDNLLRECQMETFAPNRIIEWIPYERLQDIKYLTEGGCSKIYAADWIDGRYYYWDSKEQQLIRNSACKVILKRLENVEKGNRSWLDEAKSHTKIANKFTSIAQCLGISQDPEGRSILVMRQMDMNLRTYLQQYHNQLKWKDKIQIMYYITSALKHIYHEKSVHRDLHSGNIIHSLKSGEWYIGDFGMCGPADKPLNSIYGNLPYIAPEVIFGKETTFASDIYSVGILMWEISSGQPPFVGMDHDYSLAVKIVNGMRPKTVPGTPLEYGKLMKQCWDANPLKRPKIDTLFDKINEMKKYLQSKKPFQFPGSEIEINFTNSKSASKVYQFKNIPEPKNAAEDNEDLTIPDEINYAEDIWNF